MRSLSAETYLALLGALLLVLLSSARAKATEPDRIQRNSAWRESVARLREAASFRPEAATAAPTAPAPKACRQWRFLGMIPLPSFRRAKVASPLPPVLPSDAETRLNILEGWLPVIGNVEALNRSLSAAFDHWHSLRPLDRRELLHLRKEFEAEWDRRIGEAERLLEASLFDERGRPLATRPSAGTDRWASDFAARLEALSSRVDPSFLLVPSRVAVRGMRSTSRIPEMAGLKMGEFGTDGGRFAASALTTGDGGLAVVSGSGAFEGPRTFSSHGNWLENALPAEFSDHEVLASPYRSHGVCLLKKNNEGVEVKYWRPGSTHWTTFHFEHREEPSAFFEYRDADGRERLLFSGTYSALSVPLEGEGESATESRGVFAPISENGVPVLFALTNEGWELASGEWTTHLRFVHPTVLRAGPRNPAHHYNFPKALINHTVWSMAQARGTGGENLFHVLAVRSSTGGMIYNTRTINGSGGQLKLITTDLRSGHTEEKALPELLDIVDSTATLIGGEGREALLVGVAASDHRLVRVFRLSDFDEVTYAVVGSDPIVYSNEPWSRPIQIIQDAGGPGRHRLVGRTEGGSFVTAEIFQPVN